MRRVLPLVALLTFGGIAGGAEILSEFKRPPQSDGLSAVTRVSADRYLFLDDSGGVMVSADIKIDGKGEIKSYATNSVVVLEGVRDGEGLAFDRLRGTVWAADERGPRITEHDIRSGKRVGEVKLPACYRRYRRDVSLESLAISPDGLKMWTANEEALEGDGAKATRTTGGVVRLQRFSRKNGKDAWKPDGQFAYVVDPMGGGKFRTASRSGLSDLCVMGDGTLVALEREFSIKDFFPSFRLRLYAVGFAGATDITGFEKLEGRRFTAVTKTLALDANTGFAMYEGAAMAGKTSDGQPVMLLVSDGDAEAVEMLMTVGY